LGFDLPTVMGEQRVKADAESAPWRALKRSVMERSGKVVSGVEPKKSKK